MAELIAAYDAHGRVSHIPSDWIGHPVLGAGWSLTPPEPPAETTKARAPRPAESPRSGGEE